MSRLLLVQLAQPRRRRARSAIEPDAHRQVVHARPDQRLDARQLGGPAGERRAEDDVVSRRSVARAGGPRLPGRALLSVTLLIAGELLERRRSSASPADVDASPWLLGRIARRRRLDGERRRRREARRGSSVQNAARIRRRAGEPADVGAVLARGRASRGSLPRAAPRRPRRGRGR